MFSVNFSKISIKEFALLLKSIDLLPGRKILLTDLDAVVKKLDEIGIGDLGQLRSLLKKKTGYANLAKKLDTTPEYLTVLNREINSYEPKPVELSKLEIVTKETLDVFLAQGIKNSKDAYETLQTKKQRKEFCLKTNLIEKEIQKILETCDLLRINGVGQTYAFILREMGITSPQKYLNTESSLILKKFNEINQRAGLTKAALGLRDVEYCKRFCASLDQDIEY